MPRSLVVIICVALFALLGFVGGNATGQGGIQYAVLGVVAGLAVALTTITGRRRWIAMALLAGLLLYLALFAGPEYAVAAALASALTLIVSAAALREFYEGSEIDALKHHIHLIFGIVSGFQVVELGQLRDKKPIPVQFGRRRVMTKPGVAVILERGSRQTRVAGPTFITTDPYEYISAAYDLRKSSDSIFVDSVLTSDRARVQIHASYDYGLNLRPEAARGDTSLNDQEIQAVQALNDMQNHTESDLRQFARGIVESGLRRAAAGVSIDDVLTPRGSEVVEREALRNISARAALRGQVVTSLLLDEILPEPEVGEVFHRTWAVDRENQVFLASEQARAVAWRDALRIIADGYGAAQALGMSDEAIHREVLKRTIETIAQDPATKIILPSELQVSVNGIRAHL